MWTIWYDNEKVSGSTFDEWKSCPDSGVLGIYVLYERKETYNIGQVYLGSDWYWMTPDGAIDQSIQSSDEPSVWIPNPAPDGAHSKSGIWASDDRMSEVYAAIQVLIEE